MCMNWNRRLAPIALVTLMVDAGCSEGSGDETLPVGSACLTDGECAGPGTPQCLSDGLYPLGELADSENEMARSLAKLGLRLPDGYCSTVPPCATDEDCGLGGSCFFPLKPVDPEYFVGLVAALGFPEQDAQVLEGFLEYGQCLQACTTDMDCARDGYRCVTPLEDFLTLVVGADLSTFCVGEPPPSCDPDPCEHGTCEVVDGQPVCTCQSGWEGGHCNQNIDDCDPNPCQNGGTCEDGIDSYTCTCPEGYTGQECEIPPGTAAATCVLTYDLVPGNGADDDSWTGCNMRIRDTLAGMGDGTSAVGPGVLKIRVASDGTTNPIAGKAEILYYQLTQEFFVSNTGVEVTTDVDAASPELGQSDNIQPVATGTLTLGSAPTITWEACDYPPGFNDTNESFTPDIVGTGFGCLAPYRSTGNIVCEGMACGFGNLNEGDNPRDETWEQALMPLRFSADLSTFTMDFMLVPNEAPSRSFTGWAGELVDITCQ